MVDDCEADEYWSEEGPAIGEEFYRCQDDADDDEGQGFADGFTSFKINTTENSAKATIMGAFWSQIDFP
jgi:hypothetical protein